MCKADILSTIATLNDGSQYQGKITIIKNFIIRQGYVGIKDVFEEIINSGNATQFEELRRLYKTNSPEFKVRKEKLVAFVITGKFTSGLSDAKLLEYSGMMILDFDNLGDMLDGVRNQIEDDIHTYACFLSPSGNGLKVVVRVNCFPEDHTEMFKHAARYYRKLSNVKVDPSGKNINRLCFISYDPHLYVNKHSEAFQICEMQRSKPMELF